MMQASSKGRVIVRFKGGLANQIYQLAAGRRVADALGYKLAYSDIYYRFFRNSRELLAPSVYDEEIERIHETPVDLFFDRLARRWRIGSSLLGLLGWKSNLIDDTSFASFLINGFIAKDLGKHISSNQVVLDGYFHFASVLEESGVLKRLQILKKSVTEAIGIHVRLGDYLKSPYKDFYRTVDSGYIRRAYRVLIEKFDMDDSVPVFVYSDSPREALRIIRKAIPRSCIRLAGGNSALSDLRDLTSCKYKILSNSSYSLLSWHLSAESCATVPRNWFRLKETDIRQFSTSKRLVVMSGTLQ